MSTTTPFLSIPQELRDIIIEHLLLTPCAPEPITTGLPPLPRRLPRNPAASLLQTCRALRNQVLSASQRIGPPPTLMLDLDDKDYSVEYWEHVPVLPRPSAQAYKDGERMGIDKVVLHASQSVLRYVQSDERHTAAFIEITLANLVSGFLTDGLTYCVGDCPHSGAVWIAGFQNAESEVVPACYVRTAVKRVEVRLEGLEKWCFKWDSTAIDGWWEVVKTEDVPAAKGKGAPLAERVEFWHGERLYRGFDVE